MTRPADPGGFTLIELLVTLALTGLVTMALMHFFRTTQELFTVQDQKTEMQQNLRGAMTVLSMDLQMAGYDPSGEAVAGITQANASVVAFSMDWDGNGDVNGTDERVAYDLDASGSLRRRSGGGSFQPLVKNIQSLRFSYFDSEGNATSDTEEICMVGIDLTGITAHEHKGAFITRGLSETVRVRNRGL